MACANTIHSSGARSCAWHLIRRDRCPGAPKFSPRVERARILGGLERQPKLQRVGVSAVQGLAAAILLHVTDLLHICYRSAKTPTWSRVE
jgi:hypothetical protein